MHSSSSLQSSHQLSHFWGLALVLAFLFPGALDRAEPQPVTAQLRDLRGPRSAAWLAIGHVEAPGWPRADSDRRYGVRSSQGEHVLHRGYVAESLTDSRDAHTHIITYQTCDQLFITNHYDQLTTSIFNHQLTINYPSSTITSHGFTINYPSITHQLIIISRQQLLLTIVTSQ